MIAISKTASKNILDKKIEKEFYICDVCGYELGFHVSFVRNKEGFEIILICPNCGQRFNVGWKVELDNRV